MPRHRTPAITLPPGTAFPPVALIRLGLGDGPELLDGLAQPTAAGAVVEVFGAGHAAQRNAAALKRLAARMPVVFASRAGAGELFTSTAAYPGSERDLIDSGLIPAGALDGLKARILLTVLLAAGAGRRRIAEALAATAC